MKSDDLAGLLEEAERYARENERKRNFNFVSGFCAVAGWCNYQLGEAQEDMETKVSYYKASRTWMEKALMAVPELVPSRKDFATRILFDASKSLKKREKEALADSYLSDQGLMILEQFGKLEQGIELYRTLERTKTAEEPIERSILLLKLGNEYLRMGWSSIASKEKKTAAHLACGHWKEIIDMHKNGAKLYPNVLFIAIRGLLNHDPEIRDHEAEELYDLGLKQIASRDRDKFRRNDFYAAIKRAKEVERDPFLGIII